MVLENRDRLDEPVLEHIRTDFPVFDRDSTVDEVLATIRRTGLGDRIAYFYVTGEDSRLVGVIPTRRLLAAAVDAHLDDIMIHRVVALPPTATVYDACEFFIMHKFLALPVVDENRRLLGIVDVGLLTEEGFDVAERREVEEIFQWAGVRLSQLRTATPFQSFRYRSPWLMATLAGGLGCAVIASLFETTLEMNVALALFFALALGLGESVAIQSMTITLKNLHGQGSGGQSYVRLAFRELAAAVLLGLAFGTAVALIAGVWRGETLIPATIGVSIALSISCASVIGMSVPTILHAMKRDPQVAAGPVALALADACTSFLYFGLATLALRVWG